MQHATRILPIALAMAVSLAPAALAGQTGGGGGTTATKQQQMSGMHHMMPGGISMKGQLDHAYTEALNAHESVALGMNDMAANHLSNVEMVLGHLEEQMAGGGGAGHPMMSSQMRQQLSQIRQDAANLRGNMGDRATAARGTTQLVGRFVNLYNTMGTQMPAGGGGGAAPQAMKSPAEFVGGANRAAGEAHASIVSRDWTAANLHARDLVAHLENAEKSARTAGLQANSTEMKHLRTMRNDARKLLSAIDAKSKDAAKQAGSLVTRLGSEVVHMADATRGGGAGMQHEMDR